MKQDVSFLYAIIGKKAVENEALSAAVQQLRTENDQLKLELKELKSDGDRPNEES